MKTDNKITFGRKFLGCVIATLILMGMYFVTMFYHKDAITITVTLAYGGFIMFLWVGYIGGNMFSKWVQGKHFHAELLEK